MPLDNLCSLITNQLNTGVLLIDREYNIVLQNRFLAVHSGKSNEDVIGENIFSVFPELPENWFKRKLSTVLLLNTQSFCSWEQRHHLFELPHTRPITTDSKYMAQNCTFLPIVNEGAVEHICILIEDATDVYHYQSVLNETLQNLALANRIDGLTQVYNRKHWEECLAKEFARATRYDHGLSLIMIDIDNFKALNDTRGHQCGDYVLQEMAKKVQDLLRLCDIFGRYGGEEFAVILPETSIEGAIEVGERIRAGVDCHIIHYQGTDISISLSIGIAKVESFDKRYEDLIAKADKAMYRAKETGRNRVCLA